jgi:hypothetical protein
MTSHPLPSPHSTPATRQPSAPRQTPSLLRLRGLEAIGLSCLLVALLTCLAPARADVLYLNEGEEHTGKLERVTVDTIFFTDLNAPEPTAHPMASVAHVLLSRIRPGDEIAVVASLTDPIAVNQVKNLPNPNEFPDSDYVTLFRRRDFAFQPDGSVIYTRREITWILKEPGLERANRSLYYPADRETCELTFAHTYAPDGHVYHITDDAIADEALFSATPEYDRLRKLKFALKKVDIGGIIDLQYQMVTQPPSALRPYLIDTVFGEREPVLHEELVVSHPQAMPLQQVKFNWPAHGGPKMVDSTDPARNRRQQTWTFSDRKGFIPEQNMPPTSRLFPRLVIFGKADWNSLSGPFTQAVAAAAPTPHLLEAFLNEIGAASGTTPLDQARRLHDGLIRRVRLLDLSGFEMGGVDPIPADVALTKRYGNNLARVLLLHFGLQRLGITSQPGLVNSWRQGGVMADIPNLGQAPHGMLRIAIDGRWIYAFCDSDYLPFGHIPSSIQGAPAIFLQDGSFVFDTLPEGGAAGNRNDQTVFARLTIDGSFEVEDIRRLRGPFEAGLRGMRAAKEREREMYAQRLVKRVHPKAVLSGFAISDLDDMQSPVTLSLFYRIPEAALRASDQILTFRNLWVGYQAGSASLASRTYPMEYWATEETTHSVVFELPAGYRWVPWQSQYTHDSGSLRYHSNMSQNKNLLMFTDVFTAHVKRFEPVSTYPQYRAGLLTMSDLANQWIIIEKDPETEPAEPASGSLTIHKVSGTASATPTPAGSSNQTGSGSATTTIP